MASDKAFQDEINAYKKVKTILGNNAVAFQEPAGADAGFPDFGFTITLPSGKKVDCHIEYKNSATAQMGSMRDWIFDGSTGKFRTPDERSEQKQELISLMNNTSLAVQNGKRLLADLQKYFDPSVKSIYSGSLTVVKDKMQRRVLTENFAKNTRDYQIANIVDTSLGNKIITHYKNKFAKSRVSARAQGHVLMMMIANELWYVDTYGSILPSDLKELATRFGVSQINKLGGLTAQLEVRIQPRGLNAPISQPKPTSIDVMASYRLKGKPVSGVRVI